MPFDDHVNVKGPVPPDAETLHATGLPAMAEPHARVTTMGWAATVMLAVPVCVAALASVAVAETV